METESSKSGEVAEEQMEVEEEGSEEMKRACDLRGCDVSPASAIC